MENVPPKDFTPVQSAFKPLKSSISFTAVDRIVALNEGQAFRRKIKEQKAEVDQIGTASPVLHREESRIFASYQEVTEERNTLDCLFDLGVYFLESVLDIIGLMSDCFNYDDHND